MGRARRVLRDERGYTLTELLVGVTIALVIAAAGSMIVVMAVQSQPRTTERAGQIQQGRVMLETVTRELRQGESILTASGNQLDMLTLVPVSTCGESAVGTARLCRVTYTCGSSSCTRTESAADSAPGGPIDTLTVVSGITGPNVFAPQGVDPLDPTYVGVQLVFPQDDGTEAVTLDDGAALRNHFDASGA